MQVSATTKNLKYILDADVVFTPYEFTYDSTSLPMTSTPVKKLSAGKSLCLFTNIFDVKKNKINAVLAPHHKNSEP